jgi:hypothetical protein
MNAPPPSCVTSTGVICSTSKLVVDLGVVHARDAEGVAHTDVFEGFAKQRCSGSAHVRPA